MWPLFQYSYYLYRVRDLKEVNKTAKGESVGNEIQYSLLVGYNDNPNLRRPLRLSLKDAIKFVKISPNQINSFKNTE